MIEYTYLVGSAQSKQSGQSTVTVTYNNHRAGNIRIPSRNSYKHTATQASNKHTSIQAHFTDYRFP